MWKTFVFQKIITKIYSHIHIFSMQKLFSASMYGVSGHLVEVEVDVVTGIGQFAVVGL
jgi:hypothetical protein